MWIRKTKQIRSLEKQQRFSFKAPLYISIGCWSVGILGAIFGWPSKLAGWNSGFPLTDVISWLKTNFIIFFIITFILLYILQVIFGPVRFQTSNTVICNKCFRVLNKGNISDCQCSGKFESLEEWEWIEKNI